MVDVDDEQRGDIRDDLSKGLKNAISKFLDMRTSPIICLCYALRKPSWAGEDPLELHEVRPRFSFRPRKLQVLVTSLHPGRCLSGRVVTGFRFPRHSTSVRKISESQYSTSRLLSYLAALLQHSH